MAEMDTAFLLEVNRLSGQQIETCYHCHTCTAGCPVSIDMRYGPDRIIRLIELGEKERALTTPDIWLCATCETCSARCPNGIDVAKVMDTLRHISAAEGYRSPEPRILLFHRIYLWVVQLLGRSHEAIMLGLYKLRSLDLLSDMDSGLVLVLRGKIPLLPRRIKGVASVHQIFEAASRADKLAQSADQARE
jgi:heterodisulfide reductase subunit C